MLSESHCSNLFFYVVGILELGQKRLLCLYQRLHKIWKVISSSLQSTSCRRALLTLTLFSSSIRDDLEGIASEMEGKTLDDVKKYSKVFWSRYKEIADYERQIAKIEKGESEMEKQAEIQHQLTQKVSRHRVPLQQMKINYTQPTKGKHYTEEEDRFLVIMLEKHGYGSENVYDLIRQEIKKTPLFRFDWFLKSRTSEEIKRRCATLIALIQKEQNGLENAGGEDDDDEDEEDEPKVKVERENRLKRILMVH